MRRIGSQRGVALPVVLLVLVVLSVLLAAAFAAAGTEARVNSNQEATVDAFTLAEAGLELFLAKRDSFGFTAAPPAASESTRVTFGSGYADVVLTQVRQDTVARRYGYAIRSHGVSTEAALSGTPRAERTVAQYGVWIVGSMSVLAGWTSLSGIIKNGISGSLSGIDSCGAPAVAGVAVPTVPGYSGPPQPVSGNPPILYLGTQPQTNASVKIDWAGVVNGTTAIQPDITIPPGSWPSFTDPNYWPVIKVVGDFTMPSAGRGTLIVTGALTVSGSNMWQGVMLVGGNLTSNGDNVVQGAIVSGLNVQLGAVLPPSSIGNGTKAYGYNSCYVTKAMAKTAQLVGLTNAWVDNWPTY